MSGNIFGFAAIFKVLPKYGIYERYCQSPGVLNATDNCNGQMQQYEVNTLDKVVI